MSPADLATKIAEEVFRTIERENAIVKAEIVDAVEKVVLQWQAGQQVARDAETLDRLRKAEALRGMEKTPLGEWKLVSKTAFADAVSVARDAEALSSSPVFGSGGAEGYGLSPQQQYLSSSSLTVLPRNIHLELMILGATLKTLIVMPVGYPQIVEAEQMAKHMGRNDIKFAAQHALRNKADLLRGLEFSKIIIPDWVTLSPEEKEGLDHLRVQVRSSDAQRGVEIKQI